MTRQVRDSLWRAAQSQGYYALDGLTFVRPDSAIADVSEGNVVSKAGSYFNTWLRYYFAHVQGRWVWVRTERLASS